MKLNTRGCKNSKMQSSNTGKGRIVEDSGANSDFSLDVYVYIKAKIVDNIIEFIGFRNCYAIKHFFSDLNR